MLKRYLIFCIIMAWIGAGCETKDQSQQAGKGFLSNFLHDNQTNVPFDAELQVYIGRDLTPGEFVGITATLEDPGGTNVPGSFRIDTDNWFLAFIPDDPLLANTAYTLTIITALGETFTYHFTTGPWPGIPPVVEIISPAPGDTLSGVIAVGASVTDDLAQPAQVTGALDGTTLGIRFQTPYLFYVNTALVADGSPHTIRVTATDIEGIDGSDEIEVGVENGATLWDVPFTVYNEGLAPADGMTASALQAVLPIGIIIETWVFTDATYLDWTDNLKAGDLQRAGYTENTGFNTQGVACIRIFNITMPPPGIDPYNFPASSLSLVMPDRSTIIAHLPAVSIPWFEDRAYYISADGSSHAYYTAGMVPIAPSTALNNPPAAP